MDTNQIFGITMGDSSGVGPEIALNAYRKGELRPRHILFGDLAVLEHYNRSLGYGVPLRPIGSAAEWREGALNVVDFGLLTADDVTAGEISKKSGAAAREYIVAAAEAALAGE